MADDPPISIPVTETVTVDTGADKETIQTLNAAFDDFWKEQDKKEEEPKQPEVPSAPGPSQETKEEKPVKPEPPADDSDIDKIEFAKGAEGPGETQENFKQIKQLWKDDRAKLKAEAERAKALEAQLEEAKKNAWTPETKADYEHAAGIRRKYDFVSDPDFIQKHHAPIRQQYESVLDEAVAALPDRQAAEAWAKHIKENFQPDQLNRNWWLNSVVAKVPDELNRAALLASVTSLLKMQKDRDSEIIRRTNDKSAFENWIKEKTETTAARVQEEIMAEIGVQEQRIKEVLPRDIESAKTKEERAAIEAHNERFTKLNDFFKKTVHDLSANGPRAWVRASVEATRALILEEQYKAIEKELKSVRAERDQFKQDLDKIVGARRKVSHTTGTPPASSSTSKGGLSIKNLDIRDAFKNYDWDKPNQ